MRIVMRSVIIVAIFLSIPWELCSMNLSAKLTELSQAVGNLKGSLGKLRESLESLNAKLTSLFYKVKGSPRPDVSTITLPLSTTIPDYAKPNIIQIKSLRQYNGWMCGIFALFNTHMMNRVLQNKSIPNKESIAKLLHDDKNYTYQGLVPFQVPLSTDMYPEAYKQGILGEYQLISEDIRKQISVNPASIEKELGKLEVPKITDPTKTLDLGVDQVGVMNAIKKVGPQVCGMYSNVREPFFPEDGGPAQYREQEEFQYIDTTDNSIVTATLDWGTDPKKTLADKIKTNKNYHIIVRPQDEHWILVSVITLDDGKKVITVLDSENEGAQTNVWGKIEQIYKIVFP